MHSILLHGRYLLPCRVFYLTITTFIAGTSTRILFNACEHSSQLVRQWQQQLGWSPELISIPDADQPWRATLGQRFESQTSISQWVKYHFIFISSSKSSLICFILSIKLTIFDAVVSDYYHEFSS